jgi:hypothetical protein
MPDAVARTLDDRRDGEGRDRAAEPGLVLGIATGADEDFSAAEPGGVDRGRDARAIDVDVLGRARE